MQRTFLGNPTRRRHRGQWQHSGLSVGGLPLDGRSLENGARIVGHNQGEFHRSPSGKVVGSKVGHHQVVLLQLSQLLGKYLGPAPHGHQAVRFPIRVGELGDDITLNRIPLPHLLYFVLQRQVLVPLGSQGKRIVVGINAVEAIRRQAIKDSGCAREFPPVRVSREPPGQLVAGRQLGQSPIAEFRNQRAAPDPW